MTTLLNQCITSSFFKVHLVIVEKSYHIPNRKCIVEKHIVQNVTVGGQTENTTYEHFETSNQRQTSYLNLAI